MNQDLLNRVTLNNGKELIGVIDYVNNKKIFFFDFTNEKYIEDYILIALLWMGNANHLRFSVFCSINYPDIRLPKAIILSKNDINATNKVISLTEKTKQRKRILK